MGFFKKKKEPLKASKQPVRPVPPAVVPVSPSPPRKEPVDSEKARIMAQVLSQIMKEE